MKIKPSLMWRHGAQTSVAEDVRARADEAAQLARIPGQNRLADPRTNPAVRQHADELRDEQHRRILTAGNERVMRRLRVEARRASHAEQTVTAIQEAEDARSPARSVLFLHSRRNLYMRVSLVTSLALAAGSAVGLEKVAEEYENIPAGSGYVSELGLTGLATMVILARSDLAQHGAALRKRDWKNSALWALMILPLGASMAANIHGGNFIGALCAAGAAAFSLFSYLIGDLFARAAKEQAKRVRENEKRDLEVVAMGEDLFGQEEEPAPQTFFEAQGVPFTPVSFPLRETVIAGTVVEASDSGSGHATPKSLTQGTARDVASPARQVTPEATPQVTSKSPPQVTPDGASESPGEVTPQVTEPGTPKSPATSQARGGAKSRRTDDELKAELEHIVAEHYRRNPGVEIEVKPAAKQLGIGRDRCRRLLAEMNVRPIRKAANQ